MNKSFVSKIDNFLEKLRAETPKSKSELAEIRKAERLAKLRDQADKKDNKKQLWEDF